jgi:MoaA/NifB/PqqE/SkfB family radical SAM enzyme
MSLPENLMIETSTKCNINPPCVICGRNNPNHPANKTCYFLPDNLADKLISTLKQSKSVHLHGIGEPLLYPRLFDLASYTQEDCNVGFVTNGLLIFSHIEEILINLSFISVSIDAGSAKIYRDIRHNDFFKLVNGIKSLQEERLYQELNRTTINYKLSMLEISMCLLRHNINDVENFVLLAKYLNVDKAHIYHMNEGENWKVDWFDYKKQHCGLNAIEHDENIEKAFKLAEELNVNLVMSGQRSFCEPKPLEYAYYNYVHDSNKKFYCPLIDKQVIIFIDGKMMNCCYQKGIIGNLNDNEMEEIWNSELLNKMREQNNNGIIPEICKNSFCIFQGRI